MKRLVNFFIVTGVDGDKLNKMIAEFGNNIPKYCQYTGGSSGKLFCVDDKIDFRKICKKYTGEDEYSMCKMLVEEEKYCSLYRAEPSYFHKPPYILRKVE